MNSPLVSLRWTLRNAQVPLPSGAALAACTYRLHQGVRGRASRAALLAPSRFVSTACPAPPGQSPAQAEPGALFVGAGFDPGVRGFALAALLEAVDEFAEPTTKDPAGTGTTETAAQLAEQAADAALPGSSGRALPCSTEHFGDLVPVLVARDCEQPQKGGHGWKSAAHFLLLDSNEEEQWATT